MKTTIIGLFLMILSAQWSIAQSSAEQEIINLSKGRWRAKADKLVLLMKKRCLSTWGKLGETTITLSKT